jgi:hypothetical protein
MRSRLIPYRDAISTNVTCPIAMGAITYGAERWKDNTRDCIIVGHQPVLVGGIIGLRQIESELSSILDEIPETRFSIFLHWTELIKEDIPPLLHQRIDNVFVAIDSMISPLDALKIGSKIRPTWVMIPRQGLNWKRLITESLLPRKSGSLILLSPPCDSPDGPFLDCDEILLNIQEMEIEHPLIKIQPAPHEWFLPSELTPWSSRSCESNGSVEFGKREHRHVKLWRPLNWENSLQPVKPVTVSFIVPMFWNGDRMSLNFLSASLASCQRTAEQLTLLNSETSVEYIIVVDRSHEASEVELNQFKIELDIRLSNHLTWLDIPRISRDEDWRAGWIRNVGAQYSRTGQSSFLVFLDSDCEIADVSLISEELFRGEHSLFFTQLVEPDSAHPKSHDMAPFEFCSSRLLIIRRSLFDELGGFAAAFHHYGCEDNFIVWQASVLLEKKNFPRPHIQPIRGLPLKATSHLRNPNTQDKLIAKMSRIAKSASLCYRMSLDARIHRHFYVCLGITRFSIFPRFLFKKALSKPLLRSLFAPVVFLLTLSQTRKPRSYLRGTFESFVWNLRSPARRFVAQSWRLNMFRHFWRLHSWKLLLILAWPIHQIRPCLGQVRVEIERSLISARASKWGWNHVGWRIKLCFHRLLIMAIALHGHAIRILVTSTARFNASFTFPTLHWLRQIPWRLRVFQMRIGGRAVEVFVVRIKVPIAHAIGTVWSQRWRIRVTWSRWTGMMSSTANWCFQLLFSRLPGWCALTLSRLELWRIRVYCQRLWSQRWRIRVFILRVRSRLWFFPVAIERTASAFRAWPKSGKPSHAKQGTRFNDDRGTEH